MRNKAFYDAGFEAGKNDNYIAITQIPEGPKKNAWFRGYLAALDTRGVSVQPLDTGRRPRFAV